MPPKVRHEPLTLSLLTSSEVLAFDCGSAPWEQEINTWLKHKPGVLGGAYDELSIMGNPAWLHYDVSDTLIGVSSIGSGYASFPKNSSPRLPATLLTWLAVGKAYQQNGFGPVILDYIISQAKTIYPTFTLIKGLVHVNNPAMGWYCNSRNGFRQVGQPRPQPPNGWLYQQIVLPVRQPGP